MGVCNGHGKTLNILTGVLTVCVCVVCISVSVTVHSGGEEERMNTHQLF